jgi:phage terminase large subunit-like protein
VVATSAPAPDVADPAGNRKLSKKKSTGRIDGAQALAMALGVASRHEAEAEWSPTIEVV